eukprot:scaffold160355_cov18-Tisochrysis_lutea.AAC.3
MDCAVHMCQELPRPLTSKHLATKFMEPHEQVCHYLVSTLLSSCLPLSNLITLRSYSRIRQWSWCVAWAPDYRSRRPPVKASGCLTCAQGGAWTGESVPPCSVVACPRVELARGYDGDLQPGHLFISLWLFSACKNQPHVCCNASISCILALFTPRKTQIMNVHSTTLGTVEFQTTRAECMDHVDSSYRQAEEYVVATFEVRMWARLYPWQYAFDPIPLCTRLFGICKRLCDGLHTATQHSMTELAARSHALLGRSPHSFCHFNSSMAELPDFSDLRQQSNRVVENIFCLACTGQPGGGERTCDMEPHRVRVQAALAVLHPP